MGCLYLIVYLYHTNIYLGVVYYHKESYFVFSSQTANHAGAKSACVGMGGHLAIIPDADTQYFIKFIGTINKNLKRWMTSKNKAWIDAVKTSDGTGWEWSTTHDKFYFKTTYLRKDDEYIPNGKYNNWHIYSPNKGDFAVVGSDLGIYSWTWESAASNIEAHYICQFKVPLDYYKGSYFIFFPPTASHLLANRSCIGLKGHLAIIPDAETQTFLQTKGAAYKSEGKWMTSNNIAFIDAVKTSDRTGWEWSTTHDKFYFKTTNRGTGPNIQNGKYNNWNAQNPSVGGVSAVGSTVSWSWLSVLPTTVAHFICQIKVKGTKLVASNSTLYVKYKEDSVLCSSDVIPGPPVSWKINSQDVSTNTSERVYQIITQGTLNKKSTSHLYLTRSLHRNSGVYTCNATSLDQSTKTTVIIDKRPRLLENKLTSSTYTCKFIGETSPTVHWKINGVTVEQGAPFISNTVFNEHEVSSQISHIFILGNADVVSCWATTSDGSSNVISKTGFSNAQSSIITSSPGSCPGNQLQIDWTDLTKTSGNIVYDIYVISSSKTYTKTLTNQSTSDYKYSVTFQSLAPRTEYAIKIILFPKYSKKISHAITRTAGEIPSILLAIANSIDSQCSVSWVKGPETGIIGARIVITRSLHKKATGVTDTGTSVTHTYNGISPYHFVMQPNSKYNIKVATQTCSEVGKFVVASGQCTSQVQAPDSIPTPTTIGNAAGASHIQINKVDESNGPISCYFVIGRKQGIDVDKANYTWLDIQNIISNSNLPSFCIAVLPRFSETSKEVALSSTATTQCKINPSTIISCTNKKLTNGVLYKFQVVTLTLADGVYLTQTSEPTATTPIGDPPANSNTPVVAIVILGLSTLIALVAAAYLYKKQRDRPLTQSRPQTAHFVQNNEAFDQNETNCEGAYENMDVGKLKTLNTYHNNEKNHQQI